MHVVRMIYPQIFVPDPATRCSYPHGSVIKHQNYKYLFAAAVGMVNSPAHSKPNKYLSPYT